MQQKNLETLSIDNLLENCLSEEDNNEDKKGH